jgi:hypothetical protein
MGDNSRMVFDNMTVAIYDSGREWAVHVSSCKTILAK